MPRDWELFVAGAGNMDVLTSVSGRALSETSGRFERVLVEQVEDVSLSRIAIKPAKDIRIIQLQYAPGPILLPPCPISRECTRAPRRPVSHLHPPPRVYG